MAKIILFPAQLDLQLFAEAAGAEGSGTAAQGAQGAAGPNPNMGGAAGAGPDMNAGASQGADDDVIDADFKEV